MSQEPAKHKDILSGHGTLDYELGCRRAEDDVKARIPNQCQGGKQPPGWTDEFVRGYRTGWAFIGLRRGIR